MKAGKIKIIVIAILLLITIITSLNILCDIVITFTGTGRAVSYVYDNGVESRCDGNPAANCTIKITVPEN